MNHLAEDSHTRFVAAQAALARFVAKYTALSRGLRLFIQSAVLTVGAVLVIEGKASAGIIFAASILAGRALAPVDQAIANWRGFIGARQAWHRLDQLLAGLIGLALDGRRRCHWVGLVLHTDQYVSNPGFVNNPGGKGKNGWRRSPKPTPTRWRTSPRPPES